MYQKNKLVRDGNSWAIRLPKALLQLSGIKPGSEVKLEVKRGRIVIYPASKIINKDEYERAKQEAKQVWGEAFEDVWFEIFGIDE